MASGVTSAILRQPGGIFTIVVSQRQEELPAAGAALRVLVQVWDELVSGLEQIQTSPEGLDVVLASSPSHRTVLEGSWTRTFTVLFFLPQCPLP